MPANKFSNRLPYLPGSPPVVETLGDAIRAVWDELFRISQSMFDFDRPISLSILKSDSMQASVAPSYARLFIIPSVSWEKPGGTFDDLTGIFTSPSEGLYNIYAILTAAPLTSPQVKSYNARMRVTIDFVQTGKPDQIFILEGSGLDDQYATVQGQLLYPLVKGDKLYVDAQLIRSAGTATASINTALQIHRVSGVK